MNRVETALGNWFFYRKPSVTDESTEDAGRVPASSSFCAVPEDVATLMSAPQALCSTAPAFGKHLRLQDFESSALPSWKLENPFSPGRSTRYAHRFRLRIVANHPENSVDSEADANDERVARVTSLLRLPMPL